MDCYNHPKIGAIGICTICGKPICSVCSIEFKGKMVCRSCAEKQYASQTVNEPVRTADAAKPVAPVPQIEQKPVSTPARVDIKHETKQTESAVVPSQSPVPEPVKTASSKEKESKKKEPLLAMVLSIIVPGLGQIYNDQIKKGLILLAGFIIIGIAIFVLYLITTIVTYGNSAVCCLPIFIVLFIIWVYGIYDAYKTAKWINSGIPVKDWLS